MKDGLQVYASVVFFVIPLQHSIHKRLP